MTATIIPFPKRPAARLGTSWQDDLRAMMQLWEQARARGWTNKEFILPDNATPSDTEPAA